MLSGPDAHQRRDVPLRVARPSGATSRTRSSRARAGAPPARAPIRTSRARGVPTGRRSACRTTNASLKQIAGANYTFSGRTRITLGTPAGRMTVANAAGSPTLDYPADGVIYVQSGGPCTPSSLTRPDYTLTALGTKPCGDAIVSGTYDHSLTIATENDIIATGDITHADSDDVMLGLIADGFIRVRHDASYSSASRRLHRRRGEGRSRDRRRRPDAEALLHGRRLVCGQPLGTLTVDGVVAQKYRGPVGRGGNSPTNGYIKTTSTTRACSSARRRTSSTPSSRRGACGVHDAARAPSELTRGTASDVRPRPGRRVAPCGAVDEADVHQSSPPPDAKGKPPARVGREATGLNK